MSSLAKTTNQREEEILTELRRAGGSCRVSFLAERLGVSNETIRRNIRSLEDNEVVRKVHGGVHLVHRLNEAPFQNRMDTQAEIKTRLAARVAATISDGDSVFLDVGSTTAYVAMALRSHKNLYVVTNSIFVAQTLATRNGNRVFLAGGELRSHDGGAFGAEAIDLVGRFNTQFAVFSIGAVNAEMGFMLHDFEEANIARIAAQNAQVRIVVTVAEKFGKRAPVVLDHADRFDILVSDEAPPEDIARMIQSRGIELLLAE
ncbi:MULTISPECIES: DeoR/GlpR family DNA-binding transcription regulator [Roseovarius]|jgi:DeoR family glycerol-3-phosphate regulon repressor|uniref:Transcriptional regulator n=2 Tax=Roseovarius nubinhibens TaxID=314263 RepID=A3SR04_ROSNI|nr:DeoR/GlpR family DNA-binding transcription regulator [Roseovarius nubinhibens]EAP75563.1 transcriptional regulator [Roseovarius nubinhibens ISM]MBU2998591.1 DeoR/GlpR family DNA-binding transcription regulator [Roseovarius nubinhibens]HAR53134.1 DeoR/GlpR transcriptional regulator [Roseovarius nubinhibens]